MIVDHDITPACVTSGFVVNGWTRAMRSGLRQQPAGKMRGQNIGLRTALPAAAMAALGRAHHTDRPPVRQHDGRAGHAADHRLRSLVKPSAGARCSSPGRRTTRRRATASAPRWSTGQAMFVAEIGPSDDAYAGLVFF